MVNEIFPNSVLNFHQILSKFLSDSFQIFIKFCSNSSKFRPNLIKLCPKFYQIHCLGIAWAPHSSCHICTAGDDHQALIWDIQQMPRAIEDPILAYTAAEGEINQIQWGATQPDWIGKDRL